MILRIISGRVEAGRLDDVVAAWQRDYVPIADATVGLDRYALGVRPADDGGHHLASLTLWSTLDAALATYGGNLSAARTIDGRSHGETLTKVDYYEVDENAARRRSGPSSALRLTAGMVARGMDAEIQQELRRRLADLPDEALEAFVGRRVNGADVEIAFVSTWSASPADRPLDEPLWPDITSRYDRFRIEVLDVLLEGSGA